MPQVEGGGWRDGSMMVDELVGSLDERQWRLA